MIRLTVLYNLPEGTDEAEFLRWRLGEHQAANAAAPGVLRTDFARIDARFTPGDFHGKPPYRFMTTADWPDLASFEAAFFSPESIADLKKDSEKISNAVFLISEVLATTVVGED